MKTNENYVIGIDPNLFDDLTFTEAIVYTIIKKECDKNDVVIYYFNSEKERKYNNKPSSFKITLNDNGTLSESFGSGFFDEAGKLSLELLSINSIRKN